jgi:hypothetical protein
MTTIASGTEGVIAKIEAFAHQEFNNDGAHTTPCFQIVQFDFGVTYMLRIQIQRGHHTSAASFQPDIPAHFGARISQN